MTLLMRSLLHRCHYISNDNADDHCEKKEYNSGHGKFPEEELKGNYLRVLCKYNY